MERFKTLKRFVSINRSRMIKNFHILPIRERVNSTGHAGSDFSFSMMQTSNSYKKIPR